MRGSSADTNRSQFNAIISVNSADGGVFTYMKIILALIVLSIVILFHEFGHFLFAKINHIVVEEFSLGMGPRLLSFQGKETRYSLKLILFGGSCAMKGEDLEDDSPGSFNAASPLARISVVAAGPVFNFILAFLFAAVIIGIAGADPAYVAEVTEGSPAAEAGLQAGDRIVRYEGNGIANASELSFDMSIDGVPTDQINLTYERDGKKQKINFEPATTQRYLLGFTYSADEDGNNEIILVQNKSPMYQAGVEAGDHITEVNGTAISSYDALIQYFEDHPMDGTPVSMKFDRNGRSFEAKMIPEEQTVADAGFLLSGMREKVSVPTLLKYSFGEMGYWVHVTLKSLSGLITGVFSVREMSGPVGIVSAVGTVYESAKSYGLLEVILSLMNFSVLISVNLGVMNLLPLPALDGGRLVFLIIEAIRRKPVNRKIEGIVHFAGFALLMVLMVVVCFNDVVKLLR